MTMMEIGNDTSDQISAPNIIGALIMAKPFTGLRQWFYEQYMQSSAVAIGLKVFRILENEKLSRQERR